MSTGLSIYALAALIALLSEPAAAQTAPGPLNNAYILSYVRHPDGLLGRPSFHGRFSYASVARDPGLVPIDFQVLRFGLDLPAYNRLTIKSQLVVTQEDSTVYRLTAGGRAYLNDPVSHPGPKNADGPILAPVFDLSGGISYQSHSDKGSDFLFCVRVILPVSTYLTVSSGYNYFQDLAESEVRQALLEISVYPFTYALGTEYDNPDGPAGTAAFKLTGGGSSNGKFAELTVLLPISPEITLSTSAAYERAEDPYKRSLIASAGISYYPGR